MVKAEKKTKMNRYGPTKCILIALGAMLSAVVPGIVAGTSWLHLGTPFIVLNAVATGVYALTAYLIQSPIPVNAVLTDGSVTPPGSETDSGGVTS